MPWTMLSSLTLQMPRKVASIATITATIAFSLALRRWTALSSRRSSTVSSGSISMAMAFPSSLTGTLGRGRLVDRFGARSRSGAQGKQLRAWILDLTRLVELHLGDEPTRQRRLHPAPALPAPEHAHRQRRARPRDADVHQAALFL